MNLNLDLYELSTELVDLMNAYDDAASDEEREALKPALLAYVEAQVRKVDNIRSYLKHCEMMAEGAKAEAEAQRQRANAWQGRADRLKEMVLYTMEALGAKKLEGSTGTLLRKGNGGRAPLVIGDDSLLPEECCRYDVQIAAEVYARIPEDIKQGPGFIAQRTPLPGIIRVALDAGQLVPGAHLAERGTHLEVK